MSNQINDIFCKADNTLWLSTPKGLQVYYNNHSGFLLDAEGNIWAGTSSSGVFWRDTKKIAHHFMTTNMEAGGL